MNFINPPSSTLPSLPSELLTGTQEQNADLIRSLTGIAQQFINNALLEWHGILQKYDGEELCPPEIQISQRIASYTLDQKRLHYKKLLSLSNFEGWRRSTLTSISISNRIIAPSGVIELMKFSKDRFNDGSITTQTRLKYERREWNSRSILIDNLFEQRLSLELGNADRTMLNVVLDLLVQIPDLASFAGYVDEDIEEGKEEEGETMKAKKRKRRRSVETKRKKPPLPPQLLRAVRSLVRIRKQNTQSVFYAFLKDNASVRKVTKDLSEYVRFMDFEKALKNNFSSIVIQEDGKKPTPFAMVTIQQKAHIQHKIFYIHGVLKIWLNKRGSLTRCCEIMREVCASTYVKPPSVTQIIWYVREFLCNKQKFRLCQSGKFTPPWIFNDYEDIRGHTLFWLRSHLDGITSEKFCTHLNTVLLPHFRIRHTSNIEESKTPS
jgi:hypothetical protein